MIDSPLITSYTEMSAYTGGDEIEEGVSTSKKDVLLANTETDCRNGKKVKRKPGKRKGG